MNCSFCAIAGAASAALASAAATAVPTYLTSIAKPPSVLPSRRSAAGSSLWPADQVNPLLGAHNARELSASQSAPLVGERPQSELFLGDRPQPGQAMRLHNQEEHDQRPEDHEFQMRNHGGREWYPEPAGDLVQHDRDQHDEGGAEKRPEDRAKAPDDNHEQDLKRPVDVEGVRLPGPKPQ